MVEGVYIYNDVEAFLQVIEELQAKYNEATVEEGAVNNR